eukprot:XP_762816.1 DNA topoisomerase III [Theileria parva strain Muguga]
MLNVLNVAEKPSVAKNITEILSYGNATRTLNEPRLPSKLSQLATHINPGFIHWSDAIILWLDCDREGEAIAFEVLEVCYKVKKNLIVRRAIFSSVTSQFTFHNWNSEPDIEHACVNLKEPNKNLANAVETRQEIDLRIGSAITRYLTLKYKTQINTKAAILSYGTCQLPTLGFVVERFILIENFISEPFWTINVEVTHDNIPVTFLWHRKRIFDELMNKDVSRFLRISSHRCMQLAESLYNKGYISYPRTETNAFPSSINLKSIIHNLSSVPEFSQYTHNLLNEGGFKEPTKGKNNDEAHPPIHPVNSLTRDRAESEQHWLLYEYITRRFLACCSKDAIGHQSNIILEISGELFNLKGLVIKERNWLNIYKYSSWEGKIVPEFQENQEDGATRPPDLLSESNLIDLMNKNGIGTDATMHEHIQKIQDRHYCVKDDKLRFVPTNLGKAIYYGFKEYNYHNIDLTKPSLRANMEKDMSDISVGIKRKEQVVLNYVNLLRSIYQLISTNSNKFDAYITCLSRLVPDDAPLPNNC